MKFEWSEDKNLINTRKHGVSFNEARCVFDDFNCVFFEDERFNYGEIRYIAIGGFYSEFLNKSILATVVYTERENLIRIISARKASQRERRLYEQQE